MVLFAFPESFSTTLQGFLSKLSFSLLQPPNTIPITPIPNQIKFDYYRGMAVARDEAGNPVDMYGNRTSVPSPAPTPAPLQTSPKFVTVTPQAVYNVNIPSFAFAAPQKFSYTGVLTKKEILAMPQPVTPDKLPLFVQFGSSTDFASIFQRVSVGRR